MGQAVRHGLRRGLRRALITPLSLQHSRTPYDLLVVRGAVFLLCWRDAPVWYYNLVAHPHVELRDGTRSGDMMAREVTGDERARWWQRAVAAYPPYADYQRATDRQIPVFLLTRIEPDDA